MTSIITNRTVTLTDRIRGISPEQGERYSGLTGEVRKKATSEIVHHLKACAVAGHTPKESDITIIINLAMMNLSPYTNSSDSRYYESF